MFGNSKKNKPNKNITIDEKDIKELHNRYYMNKSIDLANQQPQLNNQWKSEIEIEREKKEAQRRFRKSNPGMM